jgi:hypothetical protein
MQPSRRRAEVTGSPIEQPVLCRRRTQLKHTADTVRPQRPRGPPQPVHIPAVRPTPRNRGASDHSGNGKVCGMPAGIRPRRRHSAAAGHLSNLTAHAVATGRSARPRKRLTMERPADSGRKQPQVHGGAAPIPGRRRHRTSVRSACNCGRQSPGQLGQLALLREQRTVNPPIVPARYNFLYSSSRPALRAAACGGRPRPAGQPHIVS